MIYYISDLHLGDERIMKLCSRPFKSTGELFGILIERWNAKVTDSDDVYILGDLMLGPDTERTMGLINKLHGKI